MVAMPPSAIWSIELAWLTLTVAVLRDSVVAFRRAPMAMEAASSRAETTRVPEESFASERVAIVSEAVRFRWATFAA